MKSMKIFILYSVMAITFMSFKTVYGMEELSKPAGLMDKDTFSLRETMIDDCIDQYNILKSKPLTYGQLYTAGTKLYPLYQKRFLFNKEHNLDDQDCKDVYNSWLMEITKDERIVRLYTGFGPITPITYPIRIYQTKVDEGESVGLSMSFIRKDILESMKIYEGLYGIPHPRKNEFNGIPKS